MTTKKKNIIHARRQAKAANGAIKRATGAKARAERQLSHALMEAQIAALEEKIAMLEGEGNRGKGIGNRGKGIGNREDVKTETLSPSSPLSPIPYSLSPSPRDQLPAPVVGPVFAAGPEAVTVNWRPVPNAKGYVLRFLPDPSPPTSRLSSLAPRPFLTKLIQNSVHKTG